MKRLKRIFVLLLAGTILLNHVYTTAAYAEESNLVAAVVDGIEFLDDSSYLIPLCLTQNTGIMGFRIRLECIDDNVRIYSVSRGSVTADGVFDSNVQVDGSQVVDILWNNVENVEKDGSLMYIGVTVLEPNEQIRLNVSFEQADTFNEKYEDVILQCREISFSQNQITESDVKKTDTETEILNLEEDSREEAKSDFMNSIAVRDIGEDELKDAYLKTLAAFGTDNHEKISEEQIDDFEYAFKAFLAEKNEVDLKKAESLDFEQVFNSLVLDEDDYVKIQEYIDSGISIPSIEDIDHESDSNVLIKWIIIGIFLALFVTVIIIVFYVWRRRHEKKD